MIALLPLLLLVSCSRSGAVRLSTGRLPRETAREVCRTATEDASYYKTGTMKSGNKLRAVINLAEEISLKGVTGDVVEAGVAWGGGVIPLLFYLACTGDLANRTFYLFDTWEGLPASKDGHDAGFKTGEYLATWDLFLETKDYYGLQWRKHIAPNEPLRQTAFPSWEEAWSHVKTVKGLFADTMPGLLSGRQLALLMCDGDMYTSTLDCLSSAGNLVVKGGAIYNDDYFTFKACYQAVQDFMKSKAQRPMKASLFFNHGNFLEFPENSSVCVVPESNTFYSQSGTCWGRDVNGEILRVE